LESHLHSHYRNLNTLIHKHEDERISSILSLQSFDSYPVGRGLADAVLFGNIADALSYEKSSKIIVQYEALMSFFENICSKYFAVFFCKEKDEKYWKVFFFIIFLIWLLYRLVILLLSK
jgi:hypothetical protein